LCAWTINPYDFRSQIYEPDYVIVQDATLVDVVECGKRGPNLKVLSLSILKKARNILKWQTKAFIKTLDATKLGYGFHRKTNSKYYSYGAFAGVSGIIKPESIKNAVMERFPESR